jgi:SAM-dependent MidA family methyltransferase
MKAANVTPLERKLIEQIREHGPMPFVDYMRSCLYDPEFGYYGRLESRRFADFYTSVDVHPIFGRLLARQLAEMWDLLGRPAEFTVVESGAGTGRLAAHILDFAARELGVFYGALRYVVVEQSPARRAGHQESIAAHLARGRASSAAELPPQVPVGCILSNELLDALPVHRVVMLPRALREVYVAEGSGALTEKLGPLSTPEIAAYFEEQGITLQENQQAEAGLEVCRWVMDAGRRLGRGFVLSIDYGREASELYDERHMSGTLMAYSQHRATEDFLQAPGEQDLTAHVNFTALDLWGRRVGLAKTGCVSQMQFLVAMGQHNEFADLYEPGASEVDRIRARLMLKTLIHPEGMGETFQVFVQHKGIEAPQLTGLAGL